jgi:Fic family protein
VHEKFRDQSGANTKRQRDLVLELSTASDPVAVGKVGELTPRLAKAYAGISAKTLQRDLATVEELGLIERKPEGVRAKRELILAFLPWRRVNAKPEGAQPKKP